MTQYVLEILDGPQKGTIYSLEGSRTTIGRKPDNDVVVPDEKCSGAHAEVVVEDGRHVLRDLGSRNGTHLDGRRVEEVVLTPFDTFQIGRVQIVFRDKEQSMAVDDVQVETLDRAQLQRRGGKRRSPVGAIIIGVLLLIGGGAFVWLQFFGGEAQTGGGATAKAPLEVPRNLIDQGAASFEDGTGWQLNGLESAGWEIATGRRVANTGDFAIEAVHRADEESGAQLRLALARLEDTVQVTADSTLRLRGFVATEGAARVALRLAFYSSVDGATLTTGTVPQDYDGYTEAQLDIPVPRGMDRAEVQILALLPDADSSARADDVSLVVERGEKITPLLLQTSNGRTISGVGTAARITIGDRTVLDGMQPLTDDPLLRELAQKGELALSDAGLGLEVALIDDSGFSVRFTGDAPKVSGLVLAFPPASSNVMARAALDGPFAPRQPQFDRTPTTEMVLGSEVTRCHLRFAEPVGVSAAAGRATYDVTLHGTRAFDIVMRFEADAKAAGELNRSAAQARRSGDLAAALDAVQKVVEQHPHDDRVLREAQAVRVELLGVLGREVEALKRDGAAARFFDARNGYQRVARGVEQLLETYGQSHVPQLAELQALAASMRSGIERLDQEAGAEHRAYLNDLANALDDGGSPALGAAVTDYIRRTYPAATEDK